MRDRRLPIRALAALALLAAGGGCRPTEEPAPAAVEGESRFELEPILWARSEVAYRDFRTEPLRSLHEELTELLGEPLLFRVVPFVEERGEPKTPVLVGETLEVYYQETRTSVHAMRRRIDRAVRRVREAFPALDLNDHLLIHARLPEGKVVADLDRKLSDECGSRNALRTDVLPSVYEPGSLEKLNFALCDGPAELDAQLQDPAWPLVEENWSTEEPPS